MAVPLWSLFAIAVASSTAAGLRRPADGVFPRLFGTGDELQRRMALVGGTAQTARIAGPALGGLLLGIGGLGVTSTLDAASFAAVAAALIVVRPPYERPPASETRTESAWRSLGAGFAAARRTPGVPVMILAVFCLAGAVLPLVVLCLPLLGRDRGWTAGQTGVVGAAWTVGGLLVTVVVARRGAPGAGLAFSGPLIGIAGVALLAASASPLAGFAGMWLVGVGTSLLTTHLFPAFAEVAPEDMLARFWSLLHLAQNLPTTLVMPILGAIAAAAGLTSALVVVALLLLGTAAAAAGVVRRAPTPGRDLGTMA